jgi:hypothetical protein
VIISIFHRKLWLQFQSSSSRQQSYPETRKTVRFPYHKNQPRMSNTPPVLVVCSHSQFMTQNSQNSPGQLIPVEILSSDQGCLEVQIVHSFLDQELPSGSSNHRTMGLISEILIRRKSKVQMKPLENNRIYVCRGG